MASIFLLLTYFVSTSSIITLFNFLDKYTLDNTRDGFNFYESVFHYIFASMCVSNTQNRDNNKEIIFS